MYKLFQRILALALTLGLLLSLAATAFAVEADEETISISTAEELVEFSANCRLDTWSENLTVELENDISLEGVAFTPIASFSGTFHGNGYTISGLSLTEGLSVAGLFQRVQEGARIEDLNVSGSVKASSACEAAGGLAGRNEGEIENCSFSGSVSGSNDYQSGKVNPETGAEDFVGLAAAGRPADWSAKTRQAASFARQNPAAQLPAAK